MTRLFLLCTLILTLVFAGCSASGNGASTPRNPGSGASDPGGGGGGAALRGTVRLRTIQMVPPETAEQVLANQADLEAVGYTVAPDGTMLARPFAPAVGWQVELGAQTTVVDTDGTFTLQEPQDGAAAGLFRHPSDREMTFPFTLAELRASQPFTLPLLFRGPCGMNAGSDDQFCGPSPEEAAPRVLLPQPTQPDGLSPELRTWNYPRAVQIRDLGSYPDSFNEGCRIKDGKYDASALGDVAAYYLDYLQSTCDVYVLAGACPNENRVSDAEYVAFAALVQNNPILQDLLLGEDIGRLVPTPGKAVHCRQNHKGRHCGQVVIGDVACRLASGTIVKAGESTTIPVRPGGSVRLTLHNNGVYGITQILRTQEGAGGKLANARDQEGAFPIDEPTEVRHYSPVDYVPDFEQDNVPVYEADRELQYTPGAEATEGQEDVFRLLVDDKAITLTFRVSEGEPSLEPLEPGLQLLDMNQQGVLVYNRDGKLCLRSSSGDETELLQEPGDARINREGDVLYQPSSRQGQAVLRLADGSVRERPVPEGAASQFATGIAAISPRVELFNGVGPATFLYAQRGDGTLDLYAPTVSGPTFLQVPTPANMALRAYESSRRGGSAAGKSTLVVNVDSSDLSHAGVVGTYTFGGPWTFDIKPWTGVAEMRWAVDVNSKDEALLFEIDTIGDSFQGYSFTYTLTLSGPRGRRTLASHSDGPPDGQGSTPWRVSVEAVGLNDEGEAAGTYTYSHNDGRIENKGVLWTADGMRDITSLLPAGAPAGRWHPRLMKGRYMVLEHNSPEGAVSNYLFYRGRN